MSEGAHQPGDLPVDRWANRSRGSRAEEHALKGRGSLHDLIDEVGQLNLLASDAVREVAVRLVVAHTKERRRVIGGHQADQDDLYSALEDTASITELEAALIEKTRADLGLAPGFQVPPNSLLARLLGRDQGQRRPADGS